MKIIYPSIIFLFASLLFVSSCKESPDAPYPDNTVNFSATQLGFAESDTAKTFTVDLDYAQSTDVTAKIHMASSGVDYGTDFSLTPEPVDSIITVTIPAGSTSATIDVKKIASYFEGSETIDFTLQEVEGKTEYGPVVLGTKTALVLSFSAIISEGGTMTLQGGAGGSDAANSVYVDFSNNEQSDIARSSWNLGLYCGSTFAVKQNNTLSSMAMATSLSLSEVISEADSITYTTKLSLDFTDKSAYIDDLSGDPSGTIINQSGQVYLVNYPGLSPQLYKVKVTLKDENTYLVEYAPSYSSVVKSIEVPKNTSYNYVYVSFATDNIVSVEPEAAKWDFEWTKAVYKTPYNGGYISYPFADLVYINTLGGVTAAQVLTSTVSYADFGSSNLADLEFSSAIDVIGSNWRSTTGNGIYQDRFYVIKDPAGNVYKLRFLKMGVASDGGTRGYPELEYAIVQ